MLLPKSFIENRVLPYFALFGLCLALLLPGLTALPIMDRDSARFAQASKQMVETGNLLEIKIQEKPRHRKPPGIYWIQSSIVKLVGQAPYNEPWAYRLASLLGGVAAVLGSFYFFSKVFDRRAAFTASVMLACSLIFAVEGHFPTTDACLLAAIVAMQGALLAIYTRGRNGGHVGRGLVAFFWFAMMVGILIKGIAPAIAIITIIGLLAFDSERRWIKQLGLPGPMLVFAVTYTWMNLMSAAAGRDFLGDMLHVDLLPKLVGGHEGHGAPPGYYLALVLVTAWPFSIWLWRGVGYARLEWAEPGVRFLACWAFGTWAVSELIPTKLPHYALPIFPALFMLIALSFSVKTQLGKWMSRIDIGYRIAWMGACVGISAISVVLPYYFGESVPLVTVVALLATLCLGGYTFKLSWSNRFQSMMAPLVLASVITYGTLFQIALPAASHFWVTERIKTVLEDRAIDLTPDYPLVTLSYHEPSLIFRLGTRNVILSGVDEFPVMDGSCYLLEEQQEQAFIDSLSRANASGEKLDEIKGFFYSKGRWVTYVLFRVNRSEMRPVHLS